MKNLMRILITGVSGFVGHHFLQFLYNNRIDASVLGIDIRLPMYDVKKYKTRFELQLCQMDMLVQSEVAVAVENFQPEYVIHLASYSSVAYSWQYPEISFINNTNIFLNLVTAIRIHQPKCRVLSVGSSEEYGVVGEKDLPLTENASIEPNSPYAVARVSQEMLSKVYSNNYNMDIVMTRSFNHTGPWQDERFVIPGFIKRIKQIKNSGKCSGIIETGNINIVRDFIDVRDVVKAYFLLLKYGMSGEIYNVCTGKGIALYEVIQMIGLCLNVQVKTNENPAYIRPRDNAIVIGNNRKLLNRLEGKWQPEISLKKSIEDMLYCMKEK